MSDLSFDRQQDVEPILNEDETDVWVESKADYQRGFTDGYQRGLEEAAQINEATVTHTEEHYEREGGPCGWCIGLETAAAKIRAAKENK